MDFVRRASVFPGNEKLIAGCVRLAKYAMGQSAPEAGRVMHLALSGLINLGACESAVEFRDKVMTDERFSGCREDMDQAFRRSHTTRR